MLRVSRQLNAVMSGLYALPSNERSQNSTNFQIHDDCVAMET